MAAFTKGGHATVTIRLRKVATVSGLYKLERQSVPVIRHSLELLVPFTLTWQRLPLHD